MAQATRKARKKSKSRHCQVKIRVMEAVEKCIKQIGERGLENPTNFPSALLFSNLALKLNSLRWSIYVFNSVVKFIKSSNSHHNNLSSFSNSTFGV